jgi:soluble lytic murein transglycosylase
MPESLRGLRKFITGLFIERLLRNRAKPFLFSPRQRDICNRQFCQLSLFGCGGVALGLLWFILAALPRLVFAQDGDARETFAQAYALYTTGHFSQAQELFRKSADSQYLLADYSLHFSALVAFQQKDWELARQLLSRLRQQYPQSLWSQDGELLRAKIDLAENKYSQAFATLNALRSWKRLRNEIASEALYLQAQASDAQGDARQAYSLCQELRTSYPQSRWTPDARKDQARLKENFPDLFGLPTIQSISDEADQLVREREYGQAEILYKKLLNNVTEPDPRLSLMTRLAGLYLSLRKRGEAMTILEQIARDYPETPEAPKALYQIGQILWNRNDNIEALGYFKLIMERYPTSPYVERARYAAGDVYESAGKKEEAAELYSSLSTLFPKSPVRDDATWRLAWLYYRSGDWRKAAMTFKALNSQTTDGYYRTAALYWQARTAEKLGEGEAARELYRQVATGADESYYQALAVQALARLGVALSEPNSISTPTADETDPPMSLEIAFHFARARELAALSLHRLAVEELDEVERQSTSQTRLRPVLMREYFRNQAYGRSLLVANRLPGSYTERDRYRFPLAYWETIRQKAQQREIDPYLVLALIRQESLFDARARSPAFALGLMQLLPSTAARVAKQMGLAPPANEKLFEPDLNLTLGTQYLKDLLKRYSNNWFKAIAAYNAGETAVDRWEKEIATDDIEEFVERIPYVETRGYVKLVIRNHRIYKKLYALQK